LRERRRGRVLRQTPEQIEPVFIDATQITAAQRNAVAVEEFQNLDCDLARIASSKMLPKILRR